MDRVIEEQLKKEEEDSSGTDDYLVEKNEEGQYVLKDYHPRSKKKRKL